MSHWKIDRDPFYKLIPYERLARVGYFDDASTEPFDITKTLDTMTTPLSFIQNYIKDSKRPAVLLMTGCFAPFHHGHLNALISARQALWDAGHDKVWAFIAPDHDEYVRTKTKGYSIDTRVNIIREQIRGHEWIKLDLWAALFREYAINYTEIYHRLFLYLQKWITGIPHNGWLPLYFVAGGDNSGFAEVFQKFGGCVVVGRDGYEADTQFVNGRNVLYTNGGVEYSSSQYRQDNLPPTQKKKNLYLRLDRPWESFVENRLKTEFKRIYSWNTQMQRASFLKLKLKAKNKGVEVISLDPYIKTGYNLQISRLYDWLGMDLLGFVARPGSKSLEKQIEDIPKGKYVLYDDDICSGHTMAYVSNLLAGRDIQIVETHSFISSRYNEVLDARDFVLNSEHGGLVIGTFKDYKRYPYYLPHVNASVRASISNNIRWEQ